MRLTKLHTGRTRPQTPRRTARDETSQDSRRTPRVTRVTDRGPGEFRNPLLGIEVNLRRHLESLDESDVDQRKDLILDALIDVADTGLGFEKQIRRLVRQLRPPSTQDEFFQVTATKNILRAQRHCNDAENLKQERENRCNELRAKLDALNSENTQLEARISELEDKIMNESDHFSLMRKADQSLRQLRLKFAEMFIRKRPTLVDQECIDLAEENTQLRQTVARQKVELDLCHEITKRMQASV